MFEAIEIETLHLKDPAGFQTLVSWFIFVSDDATRSHPEQHPQCLRRTQTRSEKNLDDDPTLSTAG